MGVVPVSMSFSLGLQGWLVFAGVSRRLAATAKTWT